MKKRLTGAVTLSLLACTAMGIPTANAHTGDHKCASNEPTGNETFECKSEYTVPFGRYVSTYYNESERGFGSIHEKSNGKLRIMVCDMYTDNFRPRLDIMLSSESVVQYRDWNSTGCHVYDDRSWSTRNIRLVQEKLSGELSHKTSWQSIVL